MSEAATPNGAEPDAVPSTERRRPGGVTFVMVLAWFTAFADLIAGIWLVLISFNHAHFTTSAVDAATVRLFGLFVVVIGLLTVMVASGLGNGSQAARVLAVGVMVLRLINAAWALIVVRDLTLWPAVFDLAMAVIIIALLTNRSASDFFRKRT